MYVGLLTKEICSRSSKIAIAINYMCEPLDKLCLKLWRRLEEVPTVGNKVHHMQSNSMVALVLQHLCNQIQK
uniref:Uncharacterized protein n=1 Tax=Medicago truncatula TaxID=3880 RepID=A2Q3S9_MEDTR|nr:hypothetical protein MtrDRAFT_AC155889g5v2 [Medicago truncatula]